MKEKKEISSFTSLLIRLFLSLLVGFVVLWGLGSRHNTLVVDTPCSIEDEVILKHSFPKDWICEYFAITKTSNLKTSLSATEIIDTAAILRHRNTKILSIKSAVNWEGTSKEKLCTKQMVHVANFWAVFANDAFGLNLARESSDKGWETEATISDFASVILSIWVWDSNEGRTNGDSWYEIPYLKPAIFFGWSIQNNSMDVMRKNVNHLRREYLLNFEMTEDVGFFQGVGIGTIWFSHLLKGVLYAKGDHICTIKDLAVACWFYNASTREQDCKTGQFWRDILSIAFGENDGIWFTYGLDVGAAGLLDYLDSNKLEQFSKTLP